ncbi:HAMP domain-containing protein [Heliorestis acidaminivorans]|uniref:HAMP domain-containing protein n=1 Tax=Heliorestis acidaminivorans TaxID=553427 RepID=A0A6I0F7P2_9FIRM|nr:methyl-accepting chemotaxis protein [Heliorestis acidaminivorans]KAB2953413.1 HAMP domain-containing protein [Heliorestis acidaminivorans]
MDWLRNLKIGRKIIVILVLMAFSITLITGTGFYFMKNMNDRAEEMYDDRTLPILWLNASRGYARLIEARTLELMITDDPLRQQNIVTEIHQRLEQLNADMVKYESTYLVAYEAERVEPLRLAMEEYEKELGRTLELALNGQKEEAYQHYLQSTIVPAQVANEIRRELADYNAQIAQELHYAIESEYVTASSLMVFVGLTALIITFLLGIAISRMITRPLQEIQKMMALAGDGDLTVHGKIDSRDETGEMMAIFNKMIQQQAEIVDKVRKASIELSAGSQQTAASTEQVTTASQEVAFSVQKMAGEAEQGNQSIIDVSKVLIELSSLIQMAKNQAITAEEHSQVTLEAALQGRETVTETINRMETIKNQTVETEERMTTLTQYSHQIGVITDTITNIASQTNLLALNAAIEAARAGESGKGFAVVAEEVRKLAEQSNEGAEEVAALVRKIATTTAKAMDATRQSRQDAEQGVLIVGQAGQSLGHIVKAVDGTEKAISDIVTLTEEEVASSKKIVALINSVATIIETTAIEAEQVAASTEETTASLQTVAASTEEASAMAIELQSLMEVFNVKIRALEEMTSQEVLQIAKSDHLLWKVRIKNLLSGQGNVGPKELTSHQHCRLGKWYFSDKNPFKNDSDFIAMDRPHQQVHEAARKAVEAHNGGRKAEAESHLKELEKSSTQVLIYLDRLIKKANRMS